MNDFQFFFLPCHADDAVAAAASDCRQLPANAQLFVNMQDALDALHLNPDMMRDHCLLILIMSGESADSLASDNKLQAQAGGFWTVAPGAEEEFMKAQAWVRLLPHPLQQAPPGERETLWMAFAREQKGAQEGAWSFALRLCGGDKSAIGDANFSARVFAEREQALESLRKKGFPQEDDDLAVVALEVLKDKATYALGIVNRFRQGYTPLGDHLKMLLEQSLCLVEFLKPADVPDSAS